MIRVNKYDIIEYIEDKHIQANDNWFFHATKKDIETINNILKFGIKSAYLMNKDGNNFNGKYYISLYKYIEGSRLNTWLKNYPKIILDDINPYYAKRNKYFFRKMFINTRIPLRTSEWDGEYQYYLKVEPSKIIGIEYSFSSIIDSLDDTRIKDELLFLRDLILSMQNSGIFIPIYDLDSYHEINKEKIKKICREHLR